MAVEPSIQNTNPEKQVDIEGDALMASARSTSEVPRTKGAFNVTTPLRKSASGATFARFRIINTSDNIAGEPQSPRLADFDASYCSYDVNNTKNLHGNQSPVRRIIYNI